MTIIAPSILSANFACLGDEIRRVELAGAQWIHVDVMDGHFVPNLTIGPQVVADLRKETRLFMDVHLMIENPDRLVPDFVRAGADLITVHCEACVHLHRTLHLIKEMGVKVGVALNPATPEVCIDNILEDVDLVLVMSVNPGFGGQKFIEGTIRKLTSIKEKMTARKSSAYLETDGGINDHNAARVITAGCDVLVAGSYIFRNTDVHDAMEKLKNCRHS